MELTVDGLRFVSGFFGTATGLADSLRVLTGVFSMNPLFERWEGDIFQKENWEQAMVFSRITLCVLGALFLMYEHRARKMNVRIALKHRKRLAIFMTASRGGAIEAALGIIVLFILTPGRFRILARMVTPALLSLVLIGLMGGARGELPLGRVLVKRLRVIGSVLRSRSVEEKAAIMDAVRREVWPALCAGEIAPIIEQVMPIAQANEAHELVGSDTTQGKVVLTVG